MQTIKARCDFFEIKRNKKLLGNDTYNYLMKQCIAKSAETKLPPELKDYANFVQDYQKKNPGKYYLARKFGPVIPGAKKGDLMTKADYAKIFGDDPSELPTDLKKALAKYTDRLKTEDAERRTQVQSLMTLLKDWSSSKKPLDKAEIDRVVTQISKLDE